MRFVIVFVALLALAYAAPSEVTVVRSDLDVGPESYNFAFGTSDGTAAEASGQLKNVGSENESLAVKGSYQFIGDDGVTYLVNYIADENGFQPQGAHLPVVPQA